MFMHTLRQWIRLAGLALAVNLFVLAAGERAVAAGFVESAGTVLSVALPVAAGGAALNKGDDIGVVELAVSELATIGVTYGLKSVVDESRPDGGSHSFPSAHTSVAFSAADFMRKRYGWEYGVPAFAVASFVGYSRVEADRHHVHDVLAGAAIGIVASELFASHNDGVLVSMNADNRSCGVQFSYVW